MLGEDDDDWYMLNGVRINGKTDSYTQKNKNRCKPCEKKIPLIPLVMTTLLLFTAPSTIPRDELKDIVRCRYVPENNNGKLQFFCMKILLIRSIFAIIQYSLHIRFVQAATPNCQRCQPIRMPV